MQKIILFLSALLYSQFSFAQFNDSVHHHLSFSAGGILNRTDELSLFVLNHSAGFDINQKKISFHTAANWIYGKQQKQLTNNDLSVVADLDFLQNVQPLYYWGLASFDESYSLKIRYRFQSGAGIGYTFVRNPSFNLVVSDGLLYEASDLTDPVLGRATYQTVRNSLRIKYRWGFKKIFILEGTHFAQPSLSSFSDYILKSSSRLSVKLNTWLSVNASLDYNRISRTDRENLLFTYGVAVSSYF